MKTTLQEIENAVINLPKDCKLNSKNGLMNTMPRFGTKKWRWFKFR